MQRPTSVTVIAWIIIVLSGISLISSTFSLNNPLARELMAKSLLPISVQFAMLYFGLLLSIAAGIWMLKGQNWARLLYVIWSIIGLVVGLITSPIKVAMIPGLVFFIIITFFLFRPVANEYFSR